MDLKRKAPVFQKWWNKGSQTSHWLVVCLLYLQLPHLEARNEPSSGTPYPPETDTHTYGQMGVCVFITSNKNVRVLTGKDLMDQTISLFSGTHFTLPTVVLNLGESASVGTGMWISTLLAVERRLNWDLAWRNTEERDTRLSLWSDDVMCMCVFSLWSCTRFCCVNASQSQTRSRSEASPVHTAH